MRDTEGEKACPAPRRRLRAFATCFSGDSSGMTFIEIAIACSIVALATAIAIDYGRVESQRAHAQHALDPVADRPRTPAGRHPADPVEVDATHETRSRLAEQASQTWSRHRASGNADAESVPEATTK